jgi:hypothetical protein
MQNIRSHAALPLLLTDDATRTKRAQKHTHTREPSERALLAGGGNVRLWFGQSPSVARRFPTAHRTRPELTHSSAMDCAHEIHAQVVDGDDDVGGDN